LKFSKKHIDFFRYASSVYFIKTMAEGLCIGNKKDVEELKTNLHPKVDFASFEGNGTILLMPKSIAQIEHARFGVERQA
jgi:hypothetical protein